jgi:pimeloyl-ACP methyl ester carboxylesterase
MVLIAAVMLAVVAPVTVDASTSRGSAGPAGPGQPPIDWTTCGSGLECANVPVPLDWRHPDGPTITLAVIRHLASRPGQRIGSLFFNPGGPGDSGAAAVAERGEALTALKYSGLPDPALWPEVAAVFELAAEGDASVLDAIAAGATSDQARVLLQEQGVALVCADSPARHPATAWPGVVRRLAAVSRIGGPSLGWINAPCASWPPSSADRYTGPWNATTKHPILVIGTRFDPNTPLANARRAARRLGNAVLLTQDGYGHLSRRDPSTCVVQATGRYLMDLTTPGTVCPSDRLPFDPEFGQPRS